MVWIYEPTGSYSDALKHFCAKYDISCYVIKPSQSSAFSKSINNRNKNDKVDARMLHKMHIVASNEDIAVPCYDAKLESLHNYLRYYKALVKERVIKTNQLEAALHREDEPFIIKKLRSKIKELKNEEKELVQTMLNILMQDEEHRERFLAVTSLKGIGDVSGLVLFELFI